MPSKDFILDDGLVVKVYKRKTNRSLRLSILPSGEVRVSMPAWAPYSTGLNFAKSRQAWIRGQHKPAKLLIDGQAIGKAHHLQFIPKPAITKTTSRVYDIAITVSYPASIKLSDPEVQAVAREACVRALRAQAEQLLPQRLASLAASHSFTYSSVQVKRLKGRWGSCDHRSNIVLNLFLMQLPWELIDYVLLHELTHTNVLRHGPDFWAAMETVLPSVKALKKLMRDYQPVLNSIGQSA